MRAWKKTATPSVPFAGNLQDGIVGDEDAGG